MGTHPIFESDFDCLTEMDSDDEWENDDDLFSQALAQSQAVLQAHSARMAARRAGQPGTGPFPTTASQEKENSGEKRTSPEQQSSKTDRPLANVQIENIKKENEVRNKDTPKRSKRLNYS